MKAMNQYILILGIVALTACGDGGGGGSGGGNANPQDTSAPGVEADGRCSSGTISAYEDLRYQSSMYNTTKDKSYLRGAQSSCNKFKSLVGDKSCKAMSGSTGAEISVSKQTVDAICKEVDGLLNPPTPPAPAGDTTAVKSLKNGLSVTVKDATAINELLTAGSSAFLQAGKVIRSVSGLDRNKPLCYLEKKDASLDLRAEDILKMTSINDAGSKLAIISSDLKVQMGCLKINDTSVWTVQNLKDVFGAAGEIKVLEAPAPADAQPQDNP